MREGEDSTAKKRKEIGVWIDEANDPRDWVAGDDKLVGRRRGALRLRFFGTWLTPLVRRDLSDRSDSVVPMDRPEGRIDGQSGVAG